MRKTITTATEKLGRADSRTARAYERLLRPDETTPKPEAGLLGTGIEPRQWVRSRKEQRAKALFDSIGGGDRDR